MTLQILLFSFGELEISNLTALTLLGLTLFIFLAVGISSLKLFEGAQDAFDEEDDDNQ